MANETRDHWNTSLLSRDVRFSFPLIRDAYSDVHSFGGDSAKCDELNKLLCQKAGFKDCYVSAKHGPDDLLQSANAKQFLARLIANLVGHHSTFHIHEFGLNM